jgi:hypothetical protein
MKLKNTLGLAIGSLVAATSIGALAQGQGAVETEGFYKKEFFDSQRDFKNDGNLFGGSIGYFLTDDVELRLGYDEVHNARGEDGKNIKGSNTALDARLPLQQPVRRHPSIRFRPVSRTSRSARPAVAVVTTPPSPTLALAPSGTSPTCSTPVPA